MGKHKKHHKRHSHSHPTPAFPYPTPAFQALIPPGVGEPKPVDSPSLRVSIGLNTLQTPSTHDHDPPRHHRKTHHGSNTLTTHDHDQLKHHRKSHHHHHHRHHHTTSANTTPGLDAIEQPTVPPLRISLHDSSAKVASSTVAELQSGLAELMVSIPLSSLPHTQEKETTQEREGEGERAERHRKKKRKKHKEKRRHEQEVRDGGRGVTPGEVGGKRVHFGPEGERQSYGGKGLVQRSSVAANEEGMGGGGGGGGEIGTQQFYKHERHHQSHREHPLSLSFTSQSYLSQSRTSQPLPSQAHSSQTHPHTSHSSQSQVHTHSPSSHSSQSHSHSSHPSHPHSSQSLEKKFSDKYYQHKKRMMEELSLPPPHPLTPSPSPTPLSPTPQQATSHSRTVPPITTSLITSEPHKHHKKKKKKHRHKHSHTHLEHVDSSVEDSVVRQKQLGDSVLTTPTPDLSTSVDKELIELRPLSPLQVRKPTVLPERGKGGRGGKGHHGIPSAKKIQFSDYTQEEDGPVDQSPSLSVQTAPLPLRHTGKPPSMSLSALVPSPSEESGRTLGSVPPVKRRNSSQKYSSGKQLRLQEVADSEDYVDGRGGRGEEQSRGKGGGKREYTLADYDPPPMALEQQEPSPQHPQVTLSKTTLRMFLGNLLRLVQKRDPEGIFAEPVTDDIAPGYSSLIKHPMDLSTMATKISNHAYWSAEEFKNDFVLMCKNAMTYNSPETIYYSVANSIMRDGLKLIEKELSLRPDIRYGRVAATAPPGASLPPPSLASRGPSPTPSLQLDYNSPFLCRINLTLLQPPVSQAQMVGMETSPTSSLDVIGEVGVAAALEEQSHLTQVVVGVPPEEREGGTGEEEEGGGRGKAGLHHVSLVTEEEPAEVLSQVQRAAEEAKENLDANNPNTRFCFIQEEQSTPHQGGVGLGERKATMNILNPDSGNIDCSKPLNLTALSERIRAGNNASTVLRTELPMFKATPVAYLMNGPFGSFAPTYDSAFATLTKMDSDLLLHTYGSDLGISYSHSLLQFVKGAGSFATEMADAVLNSLTGGRHETFMEKYRAWEERERKGKNTTPVADKESEKEGEVAEGEGGKGVEGKGEGEREERGGEGEGDATRRDDVMLTADDGTVGDRRNESKIESESVREEGGVMGEGMDLDYRGSVETTLDWDEGEGESDNQISQMVGMEDGEMGVMEDGEGMEEGEGVEEEEGPALDNQGEEETDSLDLDWVLGEERGTKSHSQSPSQDGSGVSSHHSSFDTETRRTEESSRTGGKRELSASLSPPSPDNVQTSPDTVSEDLTEGAQLISDLQVYQWQRLSEPPSLGPDGITSLPPPSQLEKETASQLTSKLVSLTAQVRPRDVVQVATLHQAMGISLDSPSHQDSLSYPAPSHTPKGSPTPSPSHLSPPSSPSTQ